MELRLWAFTKRKNSTAIPPGSGQLVNVDLKRPTSVLSPTFAISGIFDNTQGYDYALWNGRYYFITNCTAVTNNITDITCEIDVLATHRSEIGSYTAFILRSSHTFDHNLYDSAIYPLTTSAVRTSTISAPIPNWSNNGTYLIRVVGTTTNNSSLGIGSYAADRTELKSLLNFMFSEGNFDFLSDSSVKSFFNPFQYIVSLTWFPFVPRIFGKTTQEISFGWWNSGQNCVVVDNDYLTFEVNIDVPTGAYGDFRDKSTVWTSLKVFLPGCGAFFINPEEVDGTISCVYSVDVATGECLVKIFPLNSSYLITTLSGSLASSISIGQLQTSNYQNASEAVHGIVSALSNPIQALGGLITGAIDMTLESAQPTPCVNGSAGNMGSILTSPLVSCSRYQSASAGIPSSTSGRALMSNRRISTLPGFIQCLNASCPVFGYSQEREQVNAYLNGGFYYE